MKVLFIGSNPGLKSPDTTAFHADSKSRKTLDSWIKGLDVAVSYANVCDYKTPDNRPLKAAEIREAVPGLLEKLANYRDHKIVAVGSTAKKALDAAGVVDYFSVVHPSGRTRQLNDPDFVAETINALISFIKGYN